MGVLVWYIRDITPWPAVVVIGAVAYAMALFALRFFRKDDIEFMKGLLGRAV